MDIINCLIIEDEPLASEILEDYICDVSFLNLVGNAKSGAEGLKWLKNEQIDLMFLDLHLPGIKGFDFLKTLYAKPKVIVVTAYHQYALEGYELDIIDYLLKPVEFERFLKAIDKVQNSGTQQKVKETDAVILIKEGKNTIPVIESNITYMESQRDYVLVHTESLTIKTKSTLTNFLKRLTSSYFIRIHKSFAVNAELIESYTSKSVKVKNYLEPIGRNYQKEVSNYLKNEELFKK